MSKTKQPSSRGWVGSLLVIAVFAAVAAALVLNAQWLRDAVQYYQYQPDAMTASFVADTSMSGEGKFLFYASQPALENAGSFNGKCGQSEPAAAILGCYNGQKIYIYNVTDARISDVRDVTAAHEMLHAAYARLSDSDRQNVDRLLEAEYAKLKDDKDLASRMAIYDKTEPGERDNELHSVIGTEIGQISPELEAYYARYFTNRSKVVALHAQYSAVFAGLQNQADALTAQINTLTAQINEQTTAYNSAAAAFESDKNTFNARANQGDFKSQADFAAERQVLVSRQESLEGVRTQILAANTQLSQLITELNSIATQTEDLNHSLDSTLAPAPKL